MNDEMKLPDNEIEPYIISVLDEDNVEHQFEMLDAIETDSDRYLALLPIFDDSEDILDSDGELVILKVINENGEDVLSTIDDEQEFNDVIDMFEERLSQIFDIDDTFDEADFE